MVRNIDQLFIERSTVMPNTASIEVYWDRPMKGSDHRLRITATGQDGFLAVVHVEGTAAQAFVELEGMYLLPDQARAYARALETAAQEADIIQKGACRAKT